MQAVSRAVKSVKSIMKVANDVSSVFIHGYTSEEKDSGTVTDEVPDSTTPLNVTANSSFISAGGEKVSDFTKMLRSSHKRKFEESFVPEHYVFPARSGISRQKYYGPRDTVINIIRQKLGM
jgi:hypothetical protein